MPFKPKGLDPHVDRRARDQARWLLRDHGCDAEAVLREKLRRDDKSAADRYRYRLTLREIARLRRTDPRKYGSATRSNMLDRLRQWLGRG